MPPHREALPRAFSLLYFLTSSSLPSTKEEKGWKIKRDRNTHRTVSTNSDWYACLILAPYNLIYQVFSKPSRVSQAFVISITQLVVMWKKNCSWSWQHGYSSGWLGSFFTHNVLLRSFERIRSIPKPCPCFRMSVTLMFNIFYFDNNFMIL